MTKIFNEKYFKQFEDLPPKTRIRDSLNESEYHFSKDIKQIFLSHCHEELDSLEGIRKKIKNTVVCNCYVDSEDSTLPRETNGETANKIKAKIKASDKFILIISEKSMTSKWRNWELGFGDRDKLEKNGIAILPITTTNTTDRRKYVGNEYLTTYPTIDTDDNNNLIVINPISNKSVTFLDWMNS